MESKLKRKYRFDTSAFLFDYEYNISWEQRKLGEISESFEYGLNAAATEYDGKHKYIRITDIDDSTHLFLQDNLTSPDIDFSTADDYLLQEGDVLFARTGASVGKTYIYRRSDGDLYFAGFLIRAKIKSDYDADFVFHNTLTDSYDSYIRITSQRSGQPGVNAQEYANFALSVPSLAEQKKIGAYFSHLDSLITLHQREYKARIFRVKQVFEDENTISWEQRKLGDVSERVKGNDGRMDLPTLTISAGSGWLDQKDRFSANIAGKEQENYTLLHKGELSYNHGNSKLAKYGAVFSLRTYEEALVPRVYHSFKVIDADADYIEYLFATKLPDKELGKLISSGARMDGLLNINYDEFMGIQISMPSIDEQKTISSYLRSIDSLITLHQREEK